MANWRQLLPILTINFISALSFSIVLPFLVILVLDFGGNALIYGLLGASFSLFQLIGSPLLGSWSDRIGRKPVLLISHLGTILSWIGLFISLSVDVTEVKSIDNQTLGAFLITVPLIILFLSRIIDGVTGGNISVAYAYLADISDEEDLSQNYGYMAVSANIGFVVGPMLSGLLGETSLGLKLPILIALVIGVIGLFLIFFLLHDTETNNDQQVDKNKSEKTTHSIRDILSIPHITILLFLNFLVFLGFNFFYVSFPPFALSDEVGWSLRELGFFYAIISLMMAITQGPVLSRASKKYSQGYLMIIGSLILGFGFFIIVIGSTFAIFMAALAISIGNGLMYPSLLGVIASHGKGEMQGKVQGVATSFGSVASIIGLIFGGILFENIGNKVFLISAGIMIILAILSFKFTVLEQDHEDTQTHHHITHKFLGSHYLHHLTRKSSSHLIEE